MKEKLTLVLDTNIILDNINKREGFYELARKVCMLGITREAKTFIAVNILTDLFYLLKRDYGSKVTQEMIEANLSYLHPIGVTADDAKAALTKKWDDFEDCLLAECAAKIKADYIITRNVKDFTQSKVTAITPAELFEKLEAQGFNYAVIDY